MREKKILRNHLTVAALVAAGLTSALAAPASAQTLTLSSPDDLTQIAIGQTVTVNVNLTGLGGGELSSLNASVASPGLLFDAAPPVSVGSILSSAADFLPNTDENDPGTIFNDGLYFPLDPADNITADGVFFSFGLTAVSVGGGNVNFDVDSDGLPLIAATDAAGNNVALAAGNAGRGLNVRVVPEPTGFAVVMGGMGLATLRRRRTA